MLCAVFSSLTHLVITSNHERRMCDGELKINKLCEQNVCEKETFKPKISCGKSFSNPLFCSIEMDNVTPIVNKKPVQLSKNNTLKIIEKTSF